MVQQTGWQLFSSSWDTKKDLESHHSAQLAGIPSNPEKGQKSKASLCPSMGQSPTS